jgi:hypothetical protein
VICSREIERRNVNAAGCAGDDVSRAVDANVRTILGSLCLIHDDVWNADGFICSADRDADAVDDNFATIGVTVCSIDAMLCSIHGRV